MTFNSKLLEEVDSLLDDIISDCYDRVSEANEKTTAKDIVSKSFTKFLASEKKKTQQGLGKINRQKILFELEEGKAVPLFEDNDEN